MCPNLSHQLKGKPQRGQEVPWLSCEAANRVRAKLSQGLVSNTAEIFCTG